MGTGQFTNGGAADSIRTGKALRNMPPRKPAARGTKANADPVAVVAEIEAGECRPVYLVHGTEGYLVERAATRIVKGLVGTGENRAEVVRIADETVDWAALTARLRTPSLFDPRLVFVVAGVELLAGKKGAAGSERGEDDEAVEPDPQPAEPSGTNPAALLEAVLDEGFGTAHTLVLTASRVDKRRTLFKAIRRVGRILEFSPAAWEQKRTAAAMLQEKFKRAGKKVSEDLIRQLARRVGTDLRRLAGEADKLVLYAGERAAITVADLDAVVGRSREEQVFDLTESLGKGDAAAAAGTLRKIIAQGEAYMMVLGFLRKQFERLLQAREILDSDIGRLWSDSMTYPNFQQKFLPALQAKEAAGEIPPSGQHPYALYKTLGQAGRFTAPAVEELLRGTLRVQKKIFSGAGHPPLLIEDLLHQACRK